MGRNVVRRLLHMFQDHFPRLTLCTYPWLAPIFRAGISASGQGSAGIHQELFDRTRIVNIGNFYFMVLKLNLMPIWISFVNLLPRLVKCRRGPNSVLQEFHLCHLALGIKIAPDRQWGALGDA